MNEKFNEEMEMANKIKAMATEDTVSDIDDDALAEEEEKYEDALRTLRDAAWTLSGVITAQTNALLAAEGLKKLALAANAAADLMPRGEMDYRDMGEYRNKIDALVYATEKATREIAEKASELLDASGGMSEMAQYYWENR